MANRFFFSKEVVALDNNEKNNSSSSEDNKKKLRLLLIFVIVFVIVFAGVTTVIQYMNKKAIEEEPTTTTTSTTVPDKQEELVDNPIDFKTLQAENSDIYSWITIDGTNVNYPIVQHPSDDDFYLKHDAQTKKWSASGAVYIELANHKGFKDPVTVIYGHNGYGSTMFTTLHKFEDTEFFNSHEYFYIYTPTSRLTYQVVSAFKYDDRHIMNSYNFSDTDDLYSFLNYVVNPITSSLKNVRNDLDVEIDSKSKIVVLSTCITNQKSSRFLVCGVLTKNEKTN